MAHIFCIALIKCFCSFPALCFDIHLLPVFNQILSRMIVSLKMTVLRYATVNLLTYSSYITSVVTTLLKCIDEFLTSLMQLLIISLQLCYIYVMQHFQTSDQIKGSFCDLNVMHHNHSSPGVLQLPWCAAISQWNVVQLPLECM